MTDLVETARSMATKAHATQRYGDLPYTVHLGDVVEVLRRFELADDVELIAAAWLHDAVEDTELTVPQVRAVLGERVASLVDAVTDGPGANRRERKARPYTMIPKTPGAIAVKLADRIANVESARRSRPRLLAMYRKEHSTFREKLYRPGQADVLWDHLDRIIHEEI